MLVTPSPTTGLDTKSSVVKALFLGNILEENLFPFPRFADSEAETLRMVLESVDKFMQGRKEEYRYFDKVGEQSEAYIESLREMGLFGLIIPEEHGGLGLSNAGYSRVLQQSSRYDASTSLTIGAHSSIGMKGLLLFGTDEQKRKYLPKLATGETIASFCLTEPGSGSDAGSIKTAAIQNPDGTWTLNGEKIWITNGAFASFFTVFARTDTPEGKLTAFIVERAYPGVSNGPKEDKLGIRASATTSVSFQNVVLPAESVLGGVGNGFKVAMAILNNGRTGLGGGSVGAMKELIKLACCQASDRKQFGKSIAEFGLVKEKIAQMTVNCFVTESIVSLVAHYIDSGVDDFSIEAAISKIFASESLWFVANESLQIAGGNGYMKDFPYERVLRDSRINMIFEGTNEILRLYVGLSGMKDVGSYLEGLKKSAAGIFNDPIKGFGTLSKFVTKKVTHLTSLGRDRIQFVDPCLAEEAAIFEQYTVRLNRAAENALMHLGKNIIGEQFITKRLAEVAIDLFAGLSTLSRVTQMIQEKGADQCRMERHIAYVFAHQAKSRMNHNLRRLITNEDSQLKDLAEFMTRTRGYPWDTL